MILNKKMNKVQKIIKNVFALAIARILPKFVSIFLVVYTARVLGPSVYGKYATAVAFTGLFSIFYDFGFNSLIVREVTRNIKKIDIYFSNFIVLKFLLCFLGYGLIIFSAHLIRYPSKTIHILYFVALSMISVSTMVTIEAFFQGVEKMEYASYTSLFERCLTVVAGIVVLKLGYGLFGLVRVILFCSVLSLVFSVIVYVKKIALIHLIFDWTFSRKLLKMAIPFALVFVSYIILTKIDVVMLSTMQGEKAVGIYVVSQKIIQILQYIPGAILGALFPLMSRLFIDSRDSLILIYKKAIKYMFYFALPMASVISLFANKIILFLYGGDYLTSAIVLQILIWACVFIFINTVFVTMLNAINKTHIASYIGGITILLNIGLNTLLIPPWGFNLSYTGASIATLCCQVAGFILYFSYLNKHFFRIGFLSSFSRPLLAGVIMTIFLYFFKERNFFLIAGSSLFLYLVVLYGIKGFDKFDKELILKCIGR